MNLFKWRYFIVLFFLCGVFLLIAQQEVVSEDNWPNTIEDFNDSHWVSAHPIPTEMSFADEPVPLHNPDIQERMDREILVNAYWQSNAFLLMKRTHKYGPLIDSILAAENVPLDFKYLAVIESGLQNVSSPAGAKGFWQFMRSTAKEFDLEVNANVDERFNLVLATQAAARYLKQARDEFGSWTLAAASYNAGRAGIRRELTRQGVSNYYDLLLNEETSRYVFRILAVKRLLEEPQQYGFQYNSDHLYQRIPTRKLKVDTVVHDFVAFAEKFGINYKILKIHNPWLREGHLNNSSRKEYTIAIPEPGYYSAP
ncbi:MAG: lytic transglycosylase domain-containing protein [Bacteroidetes bacterium]|jgi:membrane-bound lytic murein transglycosylase D|nr:lytic transglycosylase domain-containing protein [Bacteroidota bacterium]MDA0863241.1 lytic transglycosylase domain-containing protein [Bacteroidota bacterium]MDA1209795.1 lytic transglycosylase domain-containing protein [Bacteroidota bacterium]